MRSEPGPRLSPAAGGEPVGFFWTWILAVPRAALSKGGVWVGVAYCVAAVRNIVALLALRRTAQTVKT